LIGKSVAILSIKYRVKEQVEQIHHGAIDIIPKLHERILRMGWTYLLKTLFF